MMSPRQGIEAMEFFRQLAVVGAVLGALTATLWWLRSRGLTGLLPVAGKAGGRRLERLERLSLGPQHTLHLVRLGESALLLAATPSGCTLVRSVPRSQLENPEGNG